MALVGGAGTAGIGCGRSLRVPQADSGKTDGNLASSGGVAGTGGGSPVASGGAAAGGSQSMGAGDGGAVAPGGSSGAGGTVLPCAAPGTGGDTGTPGVALSATYDGQIRATWMNQTSQSLFLAGCGTVRLYWCRGTDWNQMNAFTICSSAAAEVAAHATYSESLPATVGGWYFVDGPYALGCTPGDGLYTAGCATLQSASSNVFFVPAASGTDAGGAGNVLGSHTPSLI